MTHAVHVEEENNNSALQTTWCEPETGKVWSATKQTKHLKSMLWKIKMYLPEMSHMNDAEKKKNTFTHFLQIWTAGREDLSVFTSAEKNLQIKALTINTKRIWVMNSNLESLLDIHSHTQRNFPTAFQRHEAHKM